MCDTFDVFFFFQAEDGIRDDLVTGVQTCALPIWNAHAIGATGCMQRLSVVRVKHIELDGDGTRAARPQDPDDVGVAGMRSERRRGGEGGRSRWSPDHLKKKQER